MSGKFQPIDRDTPCLLPPSVRDWLPEKHLARFVVEIVDQLDLNPLLTRYEGGGKQPCHPAMLQAAVDVESHWVVEHHLSQCAHDQREIEPTLTGLERVESQLGKAEH